MLLDSRSHYSLLTTIRTYNIDILCQSNYNRHRSCYFLTLYLICKEYRKKNEYARRER